MEPLRDGNFPILTNQKIPKILILTIHESLGRSRCVSALTARTPCARISAPNLSRSAITTDFHRFKWLRVQKTRRAGCPSERCAGRWRSTRQPFRQWADRGRLPVYRTPGRTPQVPPRRCGGVAGPHPGNGYRSRGFGSTSHSTQAEPGGRSRTVLDGEFPGRRERPDAPVRPAVAVPAAQKRPGGSTADARAKRCQRPTCWVTNTVRRWPREACR